MNILIVDSDRLALDGLAKTLCRLFLNDNIHAEESAEGAMAWCGELAASSEKLDYVFLEAVLPEKSGTELARELKKRFPSLRIIFCTSSKDFAVEAFALRAIGYLVKPVAFEDISSVLDDMTPDWRTREKGEGKKEIRVQAFGDFEIFVDGKNLEFKRQKAKELLAYLVDRHGASVTTERIASILFPEENYDKALKNRVTAVISSLRATLKGAEIEDMLVKSWNQLAVDIQRFSCDAYDYEKLDTAALNSYRGEYMFGYEWAEFSTATYDNIKKELEKKGYT
jgi:two-component SAPR family response regulator